MTDARNRRPTIPSDHYVDPEVAWIQEAVAFLKSIGELPPEVTFVTDTSDLPN